DMPGSAEALGQAPLEMAAEIPDPFEQFFLADNTLDLEGRRAGDRVGEICMPVLEGSRTPTDRVNDVGACEHRADRLVAAAKSLGDGLDVGRNAFLFPCVKRAGAAHAAHHLVEDEQGAVAVA